MVHHREIDGRIVVAGLFGAILLLFASPFFALVLLSKPPKPPKPPTPALLQGVSSSSLGLSNGCVWSASQGLDDAQGGASPDLTARLTNAFPPGSDAASLQVALLEDGFRMREPCQDDPAIQRAVFDQTGGWSPISAIVAWRQTATGRVEWTRGFVFRVGS